MPLEIERKYLDVDFDALRPRLAEFGKLLQPRHFERNLLFDSAGKTLLGKNQLLRLRRQQWRESSRCILTFKAPAPSPAGFKVRDERESAVEDFAGMAAILEGLGYMPLAEYQKVRESWDCSGVVVDLDIVPFARVVELEGEPAQLEGVARLLGLDKYESSTKTYHELHRAWRRAQGLPMSASFVFGDEVLETLLRDLG